MKNRVWKIKLEELDFLSSLNLTFTALRHYLSLWEWGGELLSNLLFICTWFLKNRVWKIKLEELDFFVWFELDFYCLCLSSKYAKNQVRPNWFFKFDFSISIFCTWFLKIRFFKFDFSKIKYRSKGGKSSAIPKGQLISEWIFGVFKSPKNLVGFLEGLNLFEGT